MASSSLFPVPRLRIFISSPFRERTSSKSTPTDWHLRDQLYSALSCVGHIPWLFEREGAREKLTFGLSNSETILRAIRASHVILAMAKTRAGSWMEGFPYLHATPFEILAAIQYGKPVFLYSFGKCPEPKLKNYLAVFDEGLFLANRRHFSPDEEYRMPERALRDVNAFAFKMGRYFSDTESAGGLFPQDLGASGLEELTETIQGLERDSQYVNAAELVRAIPISPIFRLGHAEKKAYAALLGTCGGILANVTRVSEAIRAKKCSIKLYAEIGDHRNMFSEIQALSGINCMYERKIAAYYNSLALQAAGREFSDLLSATFDSRGSIYMSQRRYTEACHVLKKVVDSEKEPSAYNFVKWKTAGALAIGRRAMHEARLFTHDQVLPSARTRETKTSLICALKGAARFSIWDGDVASAVPLLEEAKNMCLNQGYLHPLIEIAQLSQFCLT